MPSPVASALAVAALVVALAAARAGPAGEEGEGRVHLRPTKLSRLVGARTYASVAIHGDDVMIEYNSVPAVTPAPPNLRMRALGASTSAEALAAAGGEPMDAPAGQAGFTSSAGFTSVKVVTMFGRYYAVVAVYNFDAVDLLEVTDPARPVTVGSAMHDQFGFTTLAGPRAVRTADIGNKCIAVVAAMLDHGIQLIDISDPTNPTAAGAARHGAGGFTALKGAIDVETFAVDGRTYAAVAAYAASAVQFIDISDPNAPVPISAARDGVDGFGGLLSPHSLVTFVAGGRTYVMVVSFLDEGLSLIDVSDPTKPSPAAASHGPGARPSPNVMGDVDLGRTACTFTFFSNGAERMFAITVGLADEGYRVVECTDGYSSVTHAAWSSRGDDGAARLAGVSAAALYEQGDHLRVIVTSFLGDGLQIY